MGRGVNFCRLGYLSNRMKQSGDLAKGAVGISDNQRGASRRYVMGFGFTDQNGTGLGLAQRGSILSVMEETYLRWASLAQRRNIRKCLVCGITGIQVLLC